MGAAATAAATAAAETAEAGAKAEPKQQIQMLVSICARLWQFPRQRSTDHQPEQLQFLSAPPPLVFVVSSTPSEFEHIPPVAQFEHSAGACTGSSSSSLWFERWYGRTRTVGLRCCCCRLQCDHNGAPAATTATTIQGRPRKEN